MSIGDHDRVGHRHIIGHRRIAGVSLPVPRELGQHKRGSCGEGDLQLAEQQRRIRRGPGAADLLAGRQGHELNVAHFALRGIGPEDIPSPVRLEPFCQALAVGVRVRRGNPWSAAVPIVRICQREVGGEG